MKTLKMAFLLLALVCASLAPKAAQAKETRDLEASRLAARSYWYQVSANSSPALSLYYVGTATESLVYISSTLITAFAPIGTADTGFGTALGSYDLSAAAYDTFGELCDAIDGLANYGCRLLGAKRDDNTNRLRDQAATSGTNDLKAAGGFDVKFDTAPVAGGGTPEAFDLRVGVTPESGKRVVLKKCEWNANGANTALIYGKSSLYEYSLFKPATFKTATWDDTDEMYREVIADDTAESQDFTSASTAWAGDGFEFAQDAHVVVSLGNSTSTQVIGNYLRCLIEER